MPSDAERFRFLAKFRLHVAFHDDHVTLMWQEKVEHWEASPPYYPVASGKTLEEATDAAIVRYNRKHGLSHAPGRGRASPGDSRVGELKKEDLPPDARKVLEDYLIKLRNLASPPPRSS